jgi:hypothetical protein
MNYVDSMSLFQLRKVKANSFPTIEFRSAYLKLIAFTYDSNFNKTALHFVKASPI